METNCRKNDNLLDDELIALMGPDRCMDVSGAIHLKSIVGEEDTSESTSKPQHTVKPATTEKNSITTCLKELAVCCFVNIVFLILEQCGLVDPAIAVTVALICTEAGGVSIGRNLFCDYGAVGNEAKRRIKNSM